MKRFSILAIALAVAAIASGCTPPPRTSELETIDEKTGYRHTPTTRKTVVVAAFSGGGTRAAALAYGTLIELKKQALPNGTRLIDRVESVSSVSGGSVTAAYWALNGPDGLDRLKDEFLVQNVQRQLIVKGLSPLTWAMWATPAYSRIDLLRAYFDDLFDRATYQRLVDRGKRPFLVVNATDMATGYVFSFTQEQFDLLCADLAKFKLADAVAASAAYPVLLTALSLKNHSPCKAQKNACKRNGAQKDVPKERKWICGEEGPRPDWVVKDLNADPKTDLRTLLRARRALNFLNEDNRTQYAHLLDGGIADNLGLSLPLTVLGDQDEPNLPKAQPNRMDDQKQPCVVIAVNARSQPANNYGTFSAPPGISSTILTTVGAAIDSTSLLLTDKLLQYPESGTCVNDRGAPGFSVVQVGFDFIQDDKCRRWFQNISTSWALSDPEIDALIRIGGALLRESESYKKLVRDLGGTVEDGDKVGDICENAASQFAKVHAE